MHSRIALGIFSTAIAASLAGAFALASFRANVESFTGPVDESHDAAILAAQLLGDFQLQHQEWKNLLLRGRDPSTFEEKKVAIQEAARHALAKEVELKESLVRAGNTEGDALLKSFDASYAAYQAAYLEALLVLGDQAGFDPARADAIMSPKDRPVQSALVALSDLLLHVANERAAAAADSAHRSLVLVMIVAVGTIVALLVGAWVVSRYGRALQTESGRASILNRFTEVTAFAAADSTVSASNLEALELLVHPDGAVTHILNRSRDRAVPEAQLGSTSALTLTMHALSSCPGVVRGTMHVTEDVAAPLSVQCPVYPATEGTVACIPLGSPEWVGTVHLHWDHPFAFPLEERPAVVRVAEHAALAIANRRLLATLQRQANTDARTGLANIRAFDEALESALAGRSVDETLAVLMLDVDHFKDFNDRHGHPAGDDALRVLADILRSSLRENDLAARYGGEEFTILLRGTSVESALAVAERVRAQIEQRSLSLAPGVTDRITASIGVAFAPDQADERTSLLRLADEALYEAKAAGRNRVSVLNGPAVLRSPGSPPLDQRDAA